MPDRGRDKTSADPRLEGVDELRRVLTAHLPGTTIFLLDAELRILLAEGESVRQLAWFEEAVDLGRRVTELRDDLPPGVVDQSIAHYEAVLRGERRTFDFEYASHSFAVEAVPVRVGESILAVVRDVTRQRSVDRELAARATQQAAVARLGQLAIHERDLERLMEAVVRVVATTLGVEVCSIVELVAGDEGVTLATSAGWDGDAGSPLECGISVAIEGKQGPFGMLGVDCRRARRFGADDMNFLTTVAHLLAGAIDRHNEERASRHAALHDPLTALPNRTLALDRLDQALRRRERSGAGVAVLVLDLDRFKLINDALGHGAGDELLIELAPRLRAAVRPGDTVARLGGDEFVVICEGISDANAAGALGDRINAEIAVPDAAGQRVTASIGLALARAGDTPESTLRDADAAMYRAKDLGGGRCEPFDEAMRAAVLRRREIEVDLRRALERDELRVEYQPVVEIAGRQVVAVEALLRWQHPTRGRIAPLAFMPVAEETGMIVELGEWILDEACRQAAEWQQRLDVALDIAVNVSGRQIADASFPARVAAATERCGLLPGTLKLEITETVLIAESQAPLTVLRELHDQGLRLVLDDFGTGYASLSYLKRFPLDELKIDRSFVAGLGRDQGDAAIVRAAIEMTHAFGMRAVAEGVETEAQLLRLHDLGCDLAQGYLFARPLPAARMDDLLAVVARQRAVG